ncbi:SRPBCC domain-containing protein [Streptomyces diastatochromogenes]|uniref:Uncharacterized protein n=1 Tax=Streptomyces diastatochromogenes TaxID=42236 RepID=A0A233RTM4_STRDA|nr:SRPBCC domain-containing protein [Streptomyces diastatochromogenes]MCZ0984798.1 SRPBCC domain-containing protein [Streptomyces diastatochromogenes]OXY86750.1 hypothetical protein BEK98_44485 [Streptomyces diastatochromogenes]
MADSAHVTTIKRFYDMADGRITGSPAELFTEDVRIYTPKFGVAAGLDAMVAAGRGRAMFRRMEHHLDEFQIVERGDRVVVEGTTEGETVTGRTWDGRTDIPGHFCAVFDFRDGRISRMHVYFDPDLGHEDADRYPWWRQPTTSPTERHDTMPQTVDGTIRHTLDLNEVEFVRHFDAPLDQLWRFVSEPELLAKWLGGPVDKLEPFEGGEVVIQIAPKMGATVYGKVLEYVPRQVLALTWEVPAWGHTPDLMGTTMRWAVEADGDGSQLTLTHALPHSVFREHLLSAAWHLHMDQLGHLLAGHDEHYTIQQNEIHALVVAYLEKDQAEKRAYYEHLLGIRKAGA